MVSRIFRLYTTSSTDALHGAFGAAWHGEDSRHWLGSLQGCIFIKGSGRGGMGGIYRMNWRWCIAVVEDEILVTPPAK